MKNYKHRRLQYLLLFIIIILLIGLISGFGSRLYAGQKPQDASMKVFPQLKEKRTEVLVRFGRYEGFVRIVFEAEESFINATKVNTYPGKVKIVFPELFNLKASKKFPFKIKLKDKSLEVKLNEKGKIKFLRLSSPARLVFDIKKSVMHSSPKIPVINEGHGYDLDTASADMKGQYRTSGLVKKAVMELEEEDGEKKGEEVLTTPKEVKPFETKVETPVKQMPSEGAEFPVSKDEVPVSVRLSTPAEAKPSVGLTLSLDEAVLQAIENNLGLKVERYNSLITSQSILKEKGVFDPNLSLEGSESYQKAPSPSVVESSEQRSFDTSFSLSGKIPTGTEYKLAWDYQRVRGDSPFLRVNPYHLTELSLAVTQPVLKGFGIKVQTASIKVARENLKLSEYEFMNKSEELISNVIKTFYDVLLAKESLEIARFSVSIGEKILHDVQAKIKAGMLALVDEFNAEAEVAKREETLLKAENAFNDSLDSLRRVIGLEKWDIDLVLIKPALPSRDIPDLNNSIQNAQLNRKDLKQGSTELEKKKIMAQFYKNQRLPELNLFGSGGLSGLSDSSSDAFDRLDSWSDKNWKAGILFRIPLFQRQSKGDYLKAKYEKEQAEEAIKDLIQKITLEVRQAWRGISLSLKTIEASKKTRIASEKRMQAEERRFYQGLATLNDVLQFQEEYVKALLNEKKAEFDYHIAVTELERTEGTLLIKFGFSDTELRT